MAAEKIITEVAERTAVPIPTDVAQSKPYLSGEFNVDGAGQVFLPNQNAAREAAKALPFPGNKDEAWRKTSISALPLDALHLADDTSLTLSAAPQGVVFLPLAQAAARIPQVLEKYLDTLVRPDTDKFSALAAGYVHNGFVLYVPKGVQMTETLEAVVTIAQDSTIQNSRVLVVLEEGASAALHLSYVKGTGSQPALHSGILEVIVGDNARLHLVERQQLGRETWHFTHEKASVGADAAIDWAYFAFGTRLSKSFVHVSLDGKGSQARLDGLSITNSGQHLDLDTQQDHMAPITYSNLTFKTALLGTSRTVWQGMIYVDPRAVQTDGYQSSRNLILDTRAHADAIPGLEIKTDDVRCSHGATISQIDADQIFYLRSRGLDEATAREMIVNGFFQDIVDKVRDEDLRAELADIIHEKLTVEG
jgi:Fe-S cluster assembly protein SufD